MRHDTHHYRRQHTSDGQFRTVIAIVFTLNFGPTANHDKSLHWEREKKFVLPLEGLKQRSNDTSFFTRHPSFSLFHSDPKVNIYKEFKSLDLSADSVNIRDDWKGALLRAGVFPEKSVQVVEEEKAEDDLNQENNPILKRQVETIRNLVQSYMKIVTKTQLDLVPKITMHLLIDD
ncbi:hypothetical protein ACTXT7_017396, partial [Hymenolepis weldensis]